MSKMEDINKITHTKIGDNIHFYVNGKEDRGIVVKMNNAYLSVLKDGGVIDEIHINDTFFVKDILTNKTWNDMTMEEKTIELQKAHAFSPRFLTKTWEDLPQELKDVLQKTNIEESTHGQIGGNRAGVSTNTDVSTPEDYKGETTDDKKEEFKHEKEKPKVEKNNGIEESHKEDKDDMNEDWRKNGGNDDKQKNYVNKFQQGGSKFVNNPDAGSGGENKPISNTEAPKPASSKPPMSSPSTISDADMNVTSYGRGASGTHGKGRKGALKPTGEETTSGDKPHGSSIKGEIQPNDLWEAWLLAKEGDGAGNSGVTSTETTGVYNARYSDSKGRYRDQEEDKKERKEDEDEKEERKE